MGIVGFDHRIQGLEFFPCQGRHLRLINIVQNGFIVFVNEDDHGLAKLLGRILDQFIEPDIGAGSCPCDTKMLFVFPQNFEQIFRQTFHAAKIPAAEGNFDHRIGL